MNKILIIILLSNSFIFVLGRVAQLVEQLTFNQWVVGSNPAALTTFLFLIFIVLKKLVVRFAFNINYSIIVFCLYFDMSLLFLF